MTGGKKTHNRALYSAYAAWAGPRTEGAVKLQPELGAERGAATAGSAYAVSRSPMSASRPPQARSCLPGMETSITSCHGGGRVMLEDGSTLHVEFAGALLRQLRAVVIEHGCAPGCVSLILGLRSSFPALPL